MKIEVTFDRSTKQKFREECIKRLQNFVSEIKQRHPNVGLEKLLDEKEETRSNTIRVRQDLKSKREQRVAQRQSVDMRLDVSEKTSFPNSKRVSKEQIRLVKKCQIKQQEELPLILKSREDFNVVQIRQNLDRILSKLQNNQKKQWFQTEKLQRQVSQTSSKLNKLIDCLTKAKIISKNAMLSDKQIEQSQSDSEMSDSFSIRFRELADRYVQVKQSSRRVRNDSFSGTKVGFPLEQTGDSITFRHN